MTRDELLAVTAEVREVKVGQNVLEYVVNLAEAIRACPDLADSPSSRASIALMTAARAAAYLAGRAAVYPDDVKAVMPYVFRHRLNLKGEAGRSIQRVEGILHEILEKTLVPMGTRS
jgi:MoxR-like ATPase